MALNVGTLKGTLQGQYLHYAGNDPLRIKSDATMLAAAAGVTVAQAAAFMLLNIPKNNTTPGQEQFERDFKPYALNSYNPDEPDARSPLGTPIYGRIILGKASPDGEDAVNRYTDAQGREGFYQTVVLDCALVSVDFNNKVVVTNIQGAPTSIKEFICSGDNDVTITGIFNSTPGIAPMEFINNLNLLFTAPVAIPVTNYFLNQLNIRYLVIMPGTAMSQTPGSYASQIFNIKAISDVPMTEMLP
jgi:hypothetical protein